MRFHKEINDERKGRMESFQWHLWQTSIAGSQFYGPLIRVGPHRIDPIVIWNPGRFLSITPSGVAIEDVPVGWCGFDAELIVIHYLPRFGGDAAS